MTTTNVARMQETRRCTLCARSYEPKSPQQVTCGREACVRANEKQVARAYKSDPKAKTERQRRDRERKAASYVAKRGPHPLLALFGPVWASVRETASQCGLEAALAHTAHLTQGWGDRLAAELVLWVVTYRLTEGYDRFILPGIEQQVARSADRP